MKMSRIKIIKILSAVFIAQVGIIVLMTLFSSQNIKNRTVTQYLLKNFKMDEVLSIEIEDRNGSFTVDKKDENWMVNFDGLSIKANPEKISDYLNVLNGLTKGVVVTSKNNESNFASYGFTDDSKLQIRVSMKGNKKHTIHIGNPGPGRGTSYIMYNNEKKVREVKSPISTQTGNQYINWAKTTIFSDLQGKDVKTVTLIPGNDPSLLTEEYTIRQIDSGKEGKTVFDTIPEPEGPIDYVQLNTVVYNVIRLNINDYKIGGSITGRAKAASIQLSLMSNQDYEINFYEADPDDTGEFIVTISGDNHLYLMVRENVMNILKDLSSLVAPPSSETPTIE